MTNAHQQLQRPREKAHAGQHRAAYTVNEFCDRYKISRTTFYRMQREGRGPRLMLAGERLRVSVDADAEWRNRMEQEKAAA